MQHLGASPVAIAQTRRLQFAKRLLDETALPMTEIALASGYGSVRRFNDHFLSVYGRPPSKVRSGMQVESGPGFSIRLPYRPPYDFSRTLEFLAVRATPGVEEVVDGTYRRTIRMGDESGTISVADTQGNYLLCDVDLPSSLRLMEVINRVRRLFDLDADPMEIQCHLGRDEILGEIVSRNPGQRVAGSWDPFEVLIRAIVGQQVSVKGATTVMGKIVQMFGDSSADRSFFPLPESLLNVSPGSLPMPRSRSNAIRAASTAVVSGDIDLTEKDTDALRDQLVAIKGIGPWTAQYVAMRAVGDPDAMLSGDLVLRRVAEKVFGADSESALLERAEAWRPWRAYACMHLWGIAKEI
jgi:AraC family transcriptional regulator of adaptative response / DNA-3-methyladenine glycosylase II